MARSVLLLTLLVGCDIAYNLDRTPSAAPFVANPGGDADQDGTPNGIDLCPTIHDLDDVTATIDADEDGVGNACDPRPGVPDCLALFDDFSSVAPEWRWFGRVSEIGSGGLAIASDPEIVLFFDRPLDIASLWITGYLPGSGSGPRAVQLFLDHEFQQGITGRGCSAQQDTADDPTRVAHVEYLDGEALDGGDSKPVGTSTIDAGHSITLGWNHTSDHQGECFVEFLANGRVEEMSVAEPIPVGKHIAVRTTHVGLSLQTIVGFARICD